MYIRRKNSRRAMFTLRLAVNVATAENFTLVNGLVSGLPSWVGWSQEYWLVPVFSGNTYS